MQPLCKHCCFASHGALNRLSALTTCNISNSASLCHAKKKQLSLLLLCLQIENQEKREEEIHLAELTATAKNDEEVIAKLHKVTPHMY